MQLNISPITFKGKIVFKDEKGKKQKIDTKNITEIKPLEGKTIINHVVDHGIYIGDANTVIPHHYNDILGTQILAAYTAASQHSDVDVVINN